MKPALVTGASARVLLDRGYRVRALLRNGSMRRGACFSLAGMILSV